MHNRRFASLLLGVWLGGSVFMIVVATTNFSMVDTVMHSNNKQVQIQIESLTPNGARMLLRYLASEMNRFFFASWEWGQILIGSVLLVIMVFTTSGNRTAIFLSSGMLLLVLVMHFSLTPEITSLGRVIDYIPVERMTEERVQFWKYHRVYSIFEVTKIVLGVLLSAWLLVDSRSIGGSRYRKRHGSRRRHGSSGSPVSSPAHRHVEGAGIEQEGCEDNPVDDPSRVDG
jgi:hypothetical protein